MPAISSGREPRHSLPFLTIAIVAVAIGWPAFHLARGGAIPIPFTGRTLSLYSNAQAAIDTAPPAGTLRVPISVRRVDAYARVTRDDLFDPKAKAIATFPVQEASLPDDVIRDPARIIGRVLKAPKSQGYLFREADFLAEGTRPGVVAGIPAGKRAFRLDIAKVQGLYGLAAGDRFDLVEAIPIDATPAQAQIERLGGVYGSQLALDANFRNLTRKATVRVLVQCGEVVEAAGTRAIPVSASSLTQGAVTRTKPVQEMVIAVRPEEIAPLTEALALEVDITAFARSGRPDDPADSITPAPAPASPFAGVGGATGMKLVETIGGATRQVLPVPIVTPGGPGG